MGLLWCHRKLLVKVFVLSAFVSLLIVMLIPKEYESGARIMPPEGQNTAAPLLAALASRAGGVGTLSTLAGGLLGVRPSTALFVSLLHSSTISSHLVDRFQLQAAYHKRYAVDAAKKLARRTTISDDKKSGVITITVEDRDPVRARDLTQAYLDELNHLLVQTNNSSAHQERIFIEERLRSVSKDLEDAQQRLSEYASRNNAIDLKEQTRAMVEAGARVEAAIVMEQSTLSSLRQIYGDGNIRVHEAEARLATLRHELSRLGGTWNPDVSTGSAPEAHAAENELYPPLRQLPRLAVPYADLYRRVRVQETLYELLTQQFESARIEEAKDIPAVAVIDGPGIPEKKSFPPRAILTVCLTGASLLITVLSLLIAQRWLHLPHDHEAKLLLQEICGSLKSSAEGLS